MSHTITVTQVLNDPEADSDDAEYTIGGTCDRECSVWYSCAVEGCEADGEGNFHGEEHIVVGGIEGFCTQGGGCGLSLSFAGNNPEFQMTELGTFDIDLDWDGDQWNAFLVDRPKGQQ